jgi:3-isopropylmalate dehydrogenase
MSFHSPVPTRRRYRVTFLAGDGIGPELVAEASRALAEVGRLHGFRIQETHAPFGGDAVRRSGHPLPRSTREACRAADAVLVAATKEPALEGVKAELDLLWRAQRVLASPGDLVVVSPIVSEAEALAATRAFEIALSRRAHVAVVGSDHVWESIVGKELDRRAGVVAERLPLEDVLRRLAYAPDRFDVVLTQAPYAEALSEMAALTQDGPRVVASGRLPAGTRSAREATVASARTGETTLAPTGPGIFGPTHGSAPEIAGQGVANPSGILLAAALMLGEGLGERTAARTLEGAVVEALAAGALTPDMTARGEGATTRQFMDVLLQELPGARRDHELAHLEVK